MSVPAKIGLGATCALVVVLAWSFAVDAIPLGFGEPPAVEPTERLLGDTGPPTAGSQAVESAAGSDRRVVAGAESEDFTVRGVVRLYKGSVSILGRKSPHSLYREEIATFEADDSYDQRDASGFIRLNALRLKLR